MPPAVSPQGSRGGLVAAVVVFTVLFVAATIFGIYYGVQDSKAEDQLSELNSRYNKIAHDLNGPDVSLLIDQARNDPKLTDQTAMAEAIRQRDDLRDLMGIPAVAAGDTTSTDNSDPVAIGQKALSDANAVMSLANGRFSANNMMTAISDLSIVVRNLNKAVSDAQADRDSARAQAAKDSEAASEALAKANGAINTANEKLQEQIDAANDAIKKAQDDLGTVKKTFDDEQQVSSTQLDAADRQRVDLTNQIGTLQKDMTRLTDKLAGRRVEVEDAIIRRPQGEIVTIADANTVYINLGQGDQVVPGMTFEVYDKTTPLPKLGDGLNEQDLPTGKASLEVLRVLPNGSECHVTHVEPDKQIVQGDRILNLVYDRNVKFKFFVYGDFDIARTGHPTPAGADVIKRVVSQWGGNVEPTLDVETDFVVVGTPPDVPVYNADELKDPLNAQNLANAKRASEDYDAVVQKALDLHVPIMNQNKFLYFTGFYDLALR
jgi:hypothetical protein